MYVIVVGGGSVGASLVEIALGDGHDVTVIEPDPATAEAIAERFDARVLHASIAEGEIMEESEAERADALAATTEDDSANIMAMVLGLEAGIETLVSVVNDRRHRRLFERLGVHIFQDPEVIVARYLYGIICRPEVEDAVALPGGGQAFQMRLPKKAPLVGKTLDEAREEALLDADLTVVWLRRDGDARIPRADTRFEDGDRLTIFAPRPISDRQLGAFRGD